MYDEATIGARLRMLRRWRQVASFEPMADARRHEAFRLDGVPGYFRRLGAG